MTNLLDLRQTLTGEELAASWGYGSDGLVRSQPSDSAAEDDGSDFQAKPENLGMDAAPSGPLCLFSHERLEAPHTKAPRTSEELELRRVEKERLRAARENNRKTRDARRARHAAYKQVKPLELDWEELNSVLSCASA